MKWINFSLAMLPFLIVLPFVFAFICYKIMQSKGYNKDSCLWNGILGYFLEIIWVIVCLCRKDLTNPGAVKAAEIHDDDDIHFDTPSHPDSAAQSARRAMGEVERELYRHWYETIPLVLAPLVSLSLLIALIYGISTGDFGLGGNLIIIIAIVALMALDVYWIAQDRKERDRLMAEYRKLQARVQNAQKI